MDTVKEFSNSAEAQVNYEAWRQLPMTKMVLGMLGEMCLNDVNSRLPQAGVTGATTEIVALESRRLSGFASCLSLIDNLGKLNEEKKMPPETYTPEGVVPIELLKTDANEEG